MAGSTSTSTPLYIFTTSHTPLPARYPHPHKPTLLLPPLVHRSLHSALDAKPPSAFASPSSSTIIIPHPDTLLKHDVPSRLTPPDTSTTGLESDKDEIDAEVTVKLHLVAPADPRTRAGWVTESLGFLAEYKGLGSIETLLVGFSGVDYKGKKTPASELFGCGVEGLESGTGTETVSPEIEKGVRDVWNIVSASASKSTPAWAPGSRMTSDVGSGKDVKTLGTMYLPLNVLRKLSDFTIYPPKINAMDTPDCASLPEEYSEFAMERGIELWAGGGGEGADPLPVADLHNLLQEFVPVLSQSPGMEGLREGHPLTRLIPLRPDGLKYEESAERGVAVRWVLGYTVHSKTRNVVKDRGYIVAAELFA